MTARERDCDTVRKGEQVSNCVARLANRAARVRLLPHLYGMVSGVGVKLDDVAIERLVSYSGDSVQIIGTSTVCGDVDPGTVCA